MCVYALSGWKIGKNYARNLETTATELKRHINIGHGHLSAAPYYSRTSHPAAAAEPVMEHHHQQGSIWKSTSWLTTVGGGGVPQTGMEATSSLLPFFALLDSDEKKDNETVINKRSAVRWSGVFTFGSVLPGRAFWKRSLTALQMMLLCRSSLRVHWESPSGYSPNLHDVKSQLVMEVEVGRYVSMRPASGKRSDKSKILHISSRSIFCTECADSSENRSMHLRCSLHTASPLRLTAFVWERPVIHIRRCLGMMKGG